MSRKKRRKIAEDLLDAELLNENSFDNSNHLKNLQKKLIIEENTITCPSCKDKTIDSYKTEFKCPNCGWTLNKEKTITTDKIPKNESSMRKIYIEKSKPTIHDRIEKRKFLFFPTRIKNETRWFEFATIEYVYTYDMKNIAVWKKARWVD